MDIRSASRSSFEALGASQIINRSPRPSCSHCARLSLTPDIELSSGRHRQTVQRFVDSQLKFELSDHGEFLHCGGRQGAASADAVIRLLHDS
jgi:hypothetical protein